MTEQVTKYISNHQFTEKQKRYLRIKRAIDLVMALILFIPASLIMAIFIIWIKMESKGPAIFKQRRPGYHQKIFTMYKLRSMRTETRDKNGRALTDQERMTVSGNFARKTSVDELPQLINIIKGEMSVIGPRPLAVQYLPYYNEFERHRHDVRPGLSGLAQVNGRNSVNWEEKFSYDVEYADKITFWGDIKIILLSIKTALKRESIGTRGVDAPMDFDEYRRKQMESKV